MIETEGLTHIHLRVRDLDASLAFYQQVFGMQEKFRDGDLVFLNTPGSKDTITLNPQDEGLAGKSGGIEHFGFRLKPGVTHDEAIEAVQSAGLPDPSRRARTGCGLRLHRRPRRIRDRALTSRRGLSPSTC